MKRAPLGSIDVNSVLIGSPAPNGGLKEQTPKKLALACGKVTARGRRAAGNRGHDEQAVQLLPPEELQQLEELEKAFIPRETKTPFLKRKIRQFESEAEPLQLKKPLCRLEREKLEASQASAASVVNEVFWEPFFHSLLVREGLALPKHDDIAAVAARGPAAAEAAGASAGGLASLAVHKSKLELMREAAAARRQQAAGTSASEWSPVKRGPAAARGRLAAAAAASAEPGAAGGLSDLRVHKSALELAKEAATQAAEEARRPATARGRAEQAAAPGGLSDLKVHKSRLEREKEAALAAAAAAAEAGAAGAAGEGKPLGRPASAAANNDGWGSGLGDMKVHKSGLELAKESFLRDSAQSGAPRSARAQARAADDWARWDGMPLDACVKTHTTKLEKEQAAWKAAAAAHEAKRQQQNRSGGSDKSNNRR